MAQPIIESITIFHKIDESPDWSYLETEYEKLPHGKLRIISSAQIDQDFADKHPRTALRYITENAERMRQINEGLIWAVGIYAKAVVSYAISENGDRRLETFQSGGLWGIESDSVRAYFEEVEQEQLEDLKDHLKTFNVDVSNFEEIAKTTEKKDEF
jgi:hypothetical protein